MLQVQIEYLKAIEQKRHNLEDEAIRWANAEIEKFKALETQRHNLAAEDLQRLELAEKIRHNLVSENQKDKDLAIQLFTANTKAGELALKQAVEPLKAQASMVSALGTNMRGQAALAELPIKQQDANTRQKKVINDNRNTQRSNAIKATEVQYNYETASQRNAIEAEKSRWGEEAAKAKALNDAGRNVIQSAPIYMEMMGY